MKNNKNCVSGASNKIKTKLACNLEASESTTLRMGESLPTHHEDHIAGRGGAFIEQGSSASQKIAAKVTDIISRFLGCDGQAADAVSAYTQVKMEDTHKLLKISKSDCPDIWIRLPRRKWPKSWSSIENPVVPLEQNLHGHPWQDCYGKRNLRKSYCREKVSNWECFFVHRQKGSFLSMHVDDIKWLERNKTLSR